jgi:hypothetical protein
MSSFAEHARTFLEPVLLALVSGWLGFRADGYWSAFFNATGITALWAIPAMFLDAASQRDVPGIGYVATAPVWGLLAMLIRSAVHLAFHLRGCLFPPAKSTHRSWLTMIPAWAGKTLGRLNAKFCPRGKE